MRFGRWGLAVGLAVVATGAAWAALPGGDGIKQLKSEIMGQDPINAQDIGLNGLRSGVNVRYAGSEPGFEISLPRDWKIYKSGEETLGTLTFLANGPADTRSSNEPQRWPDGTIRGGPRKNDQREVLSLQPSGMIVRIGRGLSEKDLKEVRVFGRSKKLIVADSRRVEIYGYRLTTSDLGGSYNVAIATTTPSDASKGAIDFHIIYYPRASEGDGIARLESVTRTFRSWPGGAPPEPVSKKDRAR